MSNGDDFGENLTDSEIETKLDAKVSSYNGFSEKHPMKGIIYDEIKKHYRIKIENLNTYSQNLEAATDKIKDTFYAQNNTKTIKKCVKKSFFYQNHYFISYWHKNKPYFDIQHILTTLNLKPKWNKEKYNEFSPKIVHNFWHKNQFDGYILRELINEKIMYEIILSSKSFKNDITDILIQLRENGQLSITKDKISLKNILLINFTHTIP